MYSFTADDPRYLEANAGCKPFDVHGGPENIPVSRFSIDAKVWTVCATIHSGVIVLILKLVYNYWY